MPLDPSLITDTMARWQAPQAIQLPDPLAQYSKLQALKSGVTQQAIQQQQLQNEQLQYQTQQRAFQDQQALDQAYKGAITTDPNGNITYDRAKLLSSVPGHLAPTIQKSITEMDQAKATLEDTQTKARTAGADLLGSVLLPIKAANYDPAVFDATLTHAAGIGAIDPRQAAAFRQQLGPNPTPDAIQAALAPFYASPGVQKIITDRETADARKQTSDIGATKAKDEKIKTALDSAAGAQTQDQLDAGRAAAIAAGASAAQINAIPMQLNAEAMAAYQRSRLSPEQATQAAQAAQNAANLEADRKVTQEQNNRRIGIEGQNAGINAQKFAMEFGGDAVKGWAKQVEQNPDTANTVPPALRTAVMQQFTTNTGLPFPKPLAGTAVDQERASRNALDAVAQVKAALADPEIQKRIGPILGRLGSAEQTAGTAVGLTPEQELKAQQLRTNMRYLVFQEGKALMGGRIPQSLMDQLQQSSPNVKMDAGTLSGAMAGVSDAANRNLDQTFKQRFGENAARPGSTAPAPAVPAHIQQSASAPVGAVIPLPNGKYVKKLGPNQFLPVDSRGLPLQ